MRFVAAGLCIAALLSSNTAAQPSDAPKLAAPSVQPAPAQKPTNATRRAAGYEIERQSVVETYKRSGRHDPKWDRDAEVYLDRACRFFAGQADKAEWPAMVAPGQALAEAGCDDPMVNVVLGTAMAVSKDQFAFTDLLRGAVLDLKGSGYPARRTAAAAGLLGSHLLQAKRAAEAREAFDISADACVVVLSSPNLDADARAHIVTALQDLFNESYPAPVAKLVIERARAGGGDPWLTDFFDAIFQIREAWKIRGGAPAPAVPHDNMNAFEDGMRSAGDLLQKAHERCPELPHAAGAMLSVVMAGVAPEDKGLKFWFERAVEAQFDYKPVYERALLALRPRWGGSLEQMYAFGLMCAKSGRYDTIVPRYYLTAVEQICEEAQDYERIWQVEDIYGDVKETLTGLIKDPAHEKTRDADRSLLAAIAWRCGQYDDAKALLMELGDRFDARAAWAVRAPRWAVYEDAALLSSPIKDVFLRSRAETKLEHWEEARKLAEDGLRASEGQPIEVRAAAAEAVATARMKAGFESGEWTDLPFGDDIPGWAGLEGQWQFVDAKTVKAMPRPDGLVCILKAPVGLRWELEGTIEFVGSPDRANAGIIFGYETWSYSSARWLSWILRPDTKKSSTNVGFTKKASEAPAPLAKGPNAFRVRLFDDRLSCWVNGERVYDGDLPRARDGWEPGEQIGIGGYYNSVGEPVLYSNLRIRKLAQEPHEEAAAQPPAGPAAKSKEKP